MLSIWSGPHGGLPPWDELHPHDFQPLFETAIGDALAEFTAIIDQHEAPTFDNTIVALERVGRPLKQLRAMFRVHCRNLGVGSMPEIEQAIRPFLVDYDNQVSLNQPLFARIDAIYQQRHSLDAEAQRLVEKRHDSYRRAGANLPEAEKAQLAELNQQLASLETAFRQNLTKAQSEQIWVGDESLLSGLSTRQLQRFKE